MNCFYYLSFFSSMLLPTQYTLLCVCVWLTGNWPIDWDGRCITWEAVGVSFCIAHSSLSTGMCIMFPIQNIFILFCFANLLWLDCVHWQWQLLQLSESSILNVGWDVAFRWQSAEFGGIICKSSKYPASDHGYQCAQQGFSLALIYISLWG